MNVGIDIDGVLFPWSDVANEVLMDRFDIVDPGPHVRWEWLKEQTTPEQWAWLWSLEGQNAVFGQVTRTYPDVVEAFTTLLRNPRLRCHFVTHRDPRRAGLHTALFLTFHFDAHPWAGVHVLQNGCPKHSLMEWDVFIDDKPQTALEMMEHTDAKVFVPARPWNEELTLSAYGRLVRYDDPREVVEWVASR